MKFQSVKNIKSVILLFFLIQHPLIMFSSEDSTISVESHVIKANVFLESLKYDSAEFHFAQVLPLMKEQGNWDFYCSMANKYTTTLWQQGKHKEAEETARINLEKCYQYLNPDDPISGDCLLNIGVICYLTDQAGMTTEYIKKAYYLDTRFVNFPIPGNIDIYQDKVLFIMWKLPITGILIHSKDLADSMRDYFWSVWNIAKK